MYDFVVVDAGSTLSASAVTVLTAADVVVLVAKPDLPCLRNLQRSTDALRRSGVAPERTRVLLNRASDIVSLSVSQLEKVLGRAIDFQVASDYRTVAAANQHRRAGVVPASLGSSPAARGHAARAHWTACRCGRHVIRVVL